MPIIYIWNKYFKYIIFFLEFIKKKYLNKDIF